MLSKVTPGEVIIRLRGFQRDIPPHQLSVEAEILLEDSLKTILRVLDRLGFYVARETEGDPKAQIADLVLESWKRASPKQRESIRGVHPDLCRALDALEVGHVD